VTARVRFGIVSVLAACAVAGLAFIGVNFTPKPVPWMPGALATYLVAVVLGVGWALYPAFATPRTLRVPLYILSVLGLVAAFAAVSYYLMFGFWFAFGGKL